MVVSRCNLANESASEYSGSGSNAANEFVAFDSFCCSGCSEGVYDSGCASCTEPSNFEALMSTYKPKTRQCCPFDLNSLTQEATAMFAIAIFGT